MMILPPKPQMPPPCHMKHPSSLCGSLGALYIKENAEWKPKYYCKFITAQITKVLMVKQTKPVLCSLEASSGPSIKKEYEYAGKSKEIIERKTKRRKKEKKIIGFTSRNIGPT